MGLSFLMRGQLAEVFNGRVISVLVRQYRWHIRFCAAVFIGSLFTAVAAYKLAWASSNDWRPLALGFGAGAIVPLALVYLSCRGIASRSSGWRSAPRRGCGPGP